MVFFREKDLMAKCIIEMEGTKTSITNLKVMLLFVRMAGKCAHYSVCNL